MKWKPKHNTPKMAIVNCTMLAPYDEEKCKYCGRYGCKDRGYCIVAGDPPVTLSEADMAPKLIEKLHGIIDGFKYKDSLHVYHYTEPSCVRTLKRSNAEAVLDQIKACGKECRRNSDPCPFRKEDCVCQRNVDIDGSPLICLPQDRDYFDCEFHEKAFELCYRRDDNDCTEMTEKYGVSGDNDVLLMLSHRFSVAPCRFCTEGSCTNPDSIHHEGVCTLQGLMSACEQYAAVDADHNYTEGVCTYVSSLDGKDDRKIFNTSEYAYCLDLESATTLCVACRISHCIAKATGLKCLGVRRSAKNPLLNDDNPLAANAIQINYLYLTHPEDVAKFNTDLMANAVFNALTKTCKAIGCDETDFCTFLKALEP